MFRRGVGSLLSLACVSRAGSGDAENAAVSANRVAEKEASVVEDVVVAADADDSVESSPALAPAAPAPVLTPESTETQIEMTDALRGLDAMFECRDALLDSVLKLSEAVPRQFRVGCVGSCTPTVSCGCGGRGDTDDNSN
jgi:hypothetical protein